MKYVWSISIHIYIYIWKQHLFVGVGCWSNGHVWKYSVLWSFIHCRVFFAQYSSVCLFVVCENCVIIVV
jgi:hypothetical protein